jgi:hypothetical protein
MAALSAAALLAAPAREAAPQGLPDAERVELEALVAAEPPLTESDFPAALEILALMNGGALQPEVKGLAESLGVSWDRARFLIYRLSFSYPLLMWALDEGGMLRMYGTGAAVPSPEELEVLRAHGGEIIGIVETVSPGAPRPRVPPVPE